MPAAIPIPIANKLLATLPRTEYERLRSNLESVKLVAGATLCQPGDRIAHAYFPNNCVVSLLAVVEGRKALKVGLVGSEGIVGIPLALGIGVSSVRAVVQEAGTAMQIKSSHFDREFHRNPSLRRALLRYTHTLMTQSSQTAACCRFHLLEARLARLLMMTRDRMQSDDFHLTHEFLAQMLGVRRVGVTKAAGSLQQRKLISYRRGSIRLLNAKGLEAASCRCYEIIKSVPDQIQTGNSDAGYPIVAAVI